MIRGVLALCVLSFGCHDALDVPSGDAQSTSLADLGGAVASACDPLVGSLTMTTEQQVSFELDGQAFTPTPSDLCFHIDAVEVSQSENVRLGVQTAPAPGTASGLSLSLMQLDGTTLAVGEDSTSAQASPTTHVQVAWHPPFGSRDLVLRGTSTDGAQHVTNLSFVLYDDLQ